MANQERKLRNNFHHLEKETISRLVNINRAAELPTENKAKLEKLNKAYFQQVGELLGVK